MCPPPPDLKRGGERGKRGKEQRKTEKRGKICKKTSSQIKSISLIWGWGNYKYAPGETNKKHLMAVED